MTEHRRYTEQDPESVREEIRKKRSWAIGKAAVSNAFISTISFAGGVLGGGNASLVEGVHDAGDTATHGLDLIGTRSKKQRVKHALRQASGWGIVMSAGYFGWRAGVELFDPNAATPGLTATTIQGGAAGANILIHRTLHDDQHEIQHLVQESLDRGFDLEGLEEDINIEGSHRHTLGDSIVSPMIFGGMVLAEATGRAEFSNAAAALGSIATVGINGELLIPERFRPTAQPS